MPLRPDDFYDHVMAFADADGRLPLSRMTGWDTFPFAQEGLKVIPLRAPVLPEPPRRGEGGHDCPSCSATEGIWSNEHWRLSHAPEPTGAPLLLVLQPRAHHDLADLPDERAAELGMITVHLSKAIESLPHVGRVHVSRWGDGGAHLHVFFFARPIGFAQFRGTCMAIWASLLPPLPARLRDAMARRVVQVLVASFGGTAAK